MLPRDSVALCVSVGGGGGGKGGLAALLLGSFWKAVM